MGLVVLFVTLLAGSSTQLISIFGVSMTVLLWVLYQCTIIQGQGQMGSWSYDVTFPTLINH